MRPSPGCIVAYTITASDAVQINRRRQYANDNKASGQPGFIMHVGNGISAGDIYPMIITRAWGTEENSSVNGQVFLDGNDAFWVTSVLQGEGAGKFKEFPRI